MERTDKFTQVALERYQEMGIVDIDTGSIVIKDSNNLSFEEKSAILACITSSPDLYAYAAENQFHADYFNSYSSIPIAGDYIGKKDLLYKVKR